MQYSTPSQARGARRPLVSVILPTRNEERSIEKCVESILAQKTRNTSAPEFDIEVLAIDGMSDDRTRTILERYAAADPRLRVLSNERKRVPFAFNLGIRHARGEYVCILGAHTVYGSDYIAVCLAELLAHGAAACGGRVMTVPGADSLAAKLAAWTMSHPFGSSRKSFRTQREGSVDVINYAVFRRHLVIAAGGYDEELARNQDNDLNHKLRAAGHILWCTWKTRCFYFSKPDLSALFRYAFTNGRWNVLSLRKSPGSMALRHFVPLAFLLGLIAAVLLPVITFLPAPSYMPVAFWPLILLLGLYLVFGTWAAIDVALRERSPGALLLPAVFLAFHCAYGAGTLYGLAQQFRPARIPRQEPKRGVVHLGNQ